MKFFVYPINSENLAEFTRPGSTLFGHVVAGTYQGEDVHLAGNGFVAVLDLMGMTSFRVEARKFPAAEKKLLSLPWDWFEGLSDSAQYRDHETNRMRDSWAALDDHSGGFAEYRQIDLFNPDGSANLYGHFLVGHAQIAIPPQVLNLVRKLPRARFWVPKVAFHGRQYFLPVKFNGGLCLIGNLPVKTADRLETYGRICIDRGANPLPQF